MQKIIQILFNRRSKTINFFSDVLNNKRQALLSPRQEKPICHDDFLCYDKLQDIKKSIHRIFFHTFRIHWLLRITSEDLDYRCSRQ
jgi:hypothetical protein